MVRVAVACPFGSDVTERGLKEHVGADCTGCTEQLSVTASPNALRWANVSVEVALCPRLTLPGVSADAEMEKSAPVVFSSTATELSKPFAVIISGSRSAFKSTTETEKG